MIRNIQLQLQFIYSLQEGFKMGKKNGESYQPVTKKQGLLKKAKKLQITKQLFPQLVTQQQQKINKQKGVAEKNVMDQEFEEQEVDKKQSNEEEQEEYDVADAQKMKNSDKLSEVVTQLLVKNKVNSKNAFDIPLINLEDLSEFWKTNQGEGAWKKLSSTLESDYKIYAFRVDSAHAQTYRVLSTINRAEKVEPIAKQPDHKLELFNMEAFNQVINPDIGKETLEKNIGNLNIDNLEYTFDVNPYYENTRRSFDDGHVRGLLTNNLKINNQIQLMIDGNTIEEESKMQSKIELQDYLTQYNIKFEPNLKQFRMGDKLKKEKEACMKFFKKQYDIVIDLNAKIEFELVEVYQESDKESEDEEQPNKDTKMDEQKQEQLPAKTPTPVHEGVKLLKEKIVINYQNKKNQIGSGFMAFEEDAANWMSATDMKFTKMRVDGLKKKEEPEKVVKKVLSTDEFIDFNESVMEDRGQLFKRQEINLEKQTQTFENYFLLPMNPIKRFDFNEITSLKNVETHEIETYDKQENEQNQDIEALIKMENKRTQSSIKEIKQELNTYIKSRQKKHPITFIGSYADISSSSAEVSIQSCFVTFLHLANENSYLLRNQNDADFVIIAE